jgi:hypothetical protein
MSQSTDLDRFLALSLVLTGEDHLDKSLAEQYLKRLNDQYSQEMRNLLGEFDKIAKSSNLVLEVKQKIVENDGFHHLTAQIIKTWYTSEFNGPDNKTVFTGTQEQYYSGLLWKVIKAHPPSRSTEEYGYWTTQPE